MKGNGKHSSTERFLKGKQMPGTNESIVEVLAHANGTRTIRTSANQTIQVSKAGITAVLKSVMTLHQKEIAKNSIGPAVGGKVRVQLGGLQRGKTKTYASEKNALKAVEKHYPEPAPARFPVKQQMKKARQRFSETLKSIRGRI